MNCNCYRKGVALREDDNKEIKIEGELLEKQTDLSASQSIMTIDNKVINRAGTVNFQALIGMYNENDEPAYSTNTTTNMMNNVDQSQNQFIF